MLIWTARLYAQIQLKTNYPLSAACVYIGIA